MEDIKRKRKQICGSVDSDIMDAFDKLANKIKARRGTPKGRLIDQALILFLRENGIDWNKEGDN